MRDPAHKVELLLGAALELFAEHGFHGTSVDMIARRAGVGMGTLYRYFPSKDELVVGVYTRLKEKAQALLWAGDSPDLPYRARLRHLWMASAVAMRDHPAEAAFLDQFYGSPYAHRVDPETLHRLTGRVRELLDDAVRAQVIRPLPPELYEALFFHPTLTLARMHHHGLTQLDDALLERGFEGCWNAIRQ